MSYKTPLLVFDSECSLCLRFVQTLKKIDIKNTMNYECLHNKELYQYFTDLNFETCNEEVHLVLDDKILKGAEVIEYLVSKIPGVDKFAWLIKKDSSRSAMKFFYKKLNSIRVQSKKGCKTC